MTGMFILALLLFSTGCMGTFPKPLTPDEEEKYINEYLDGSEKAKKYTDRTKSASGGPCS